MIHHTRACSHTHEKLNPTSIQENGGANELKNKQQTMTRQDLGLR